jgi:hypothetical protein
MEKMYRKPNAQNDDLKHLVHLCLENCCVFAPFQNSHRAPKFARFFVLVGNILVRGCAKLVVFVVSFRMLVRFQVAKADRL